MNIEEREEIINATIERVFKMLPEVIGNLMTSTVLNNKLTEEFYKSNPDFKDHRDIVREMVNKIEGKDPTKSYDDILKAAIPSIKEAIEFKSKTASNIPNRDSLDLSVEDNGAI